MALKPLKWTNERRKLGDLVPWPRNPRQIKEAEAGRLLDSFNEFGQVETIAIGPDNEVYNGHQRLNVLMEQHGPDYEVDVRVSNRPLTEKEREKLTVYLHKGAAGEWDYDILANEFEVPELVEWGFDPAELGIDLEPENKGTDTDPQIDKAEELRVKWGVEPGQMWALGDHRLICGDCTDKATVERVMDGELCELLFTSPPYSDQRDYNGADISIEKLSQVFFYSPQPNYYVVNLGLKSIDGEIYPYWNEWIDRGKESGLKFLAWNVWDKMHARSVHHQTSMFGMQHEWIFVFGPNEKPLNRVWEKSHQSDERAKYYRVNSKGQKVTSRRRKDGSTSDSVIGEIYAKKQLGSIVTLYAEMSRKITSHPAMYPVELPQVYVESMTDHNDLTLDPFSGSGTTIIACENLNRRCRAIEIDPGYVAVALQRWHDHTGKTPELIDTVKLETTGG